MKTLDFTPLRGPDGQIAPMDRAKALMKYGPGWFATLEGQDHVVALLGRQLDSRFTVFRNHTLPGTELMFPLILVGPVGVFVLNVVNERGIFRAKGDEWGIIQGEKIVQARVNPLKRTAQFVSILKKYLEKQNLPDVAVEAVLLGANPGLQVESVRPVARVVMFDALDRFAISVAQSRPIFAQDLVQQIVARIEAPAAPKAAPVAPPPVAAPSAPESTGGFFDEQPGQSSGSADDDRLGFGFSDEPQGGFSQPEPASREREAPRSEQVQPARSAERKPAAAPRKKKKSRGFSTRQITILGAFFLFWVCLLVGFIIWAVINAS